MKKILVINGSPRTKEISTSFRMFEALKKHQGWSDEIIEILDLNNIEVPYLTQEMLNENPYELSGLRKQYVEQFENFDIYVFIYPTWNFSTPALLKAYLDLITVSGRMFEAKSNRLVGKLHNKKAFLVNSTGGPLLGKFLNRFINVVDPYYMMKATLNMIGIKDITNLSLSSVDIKYRSQTGLDYHKLDLAITKKLSKVKKYGVL